MLRRLYAVKLEYLCKARPDVIAIIGRYGYDKNYLLVLLRRYLP